jgi:hypothetical protein
VKSVSTHWLPPAFWHAFSTPKLASSNEFALTQLAQTPVEDDSAMAEYFVEFAGPTGTVGAPGTRGIGGLASAVAAEPKLAAAVPAATIMVAAMIRRRWLDLFE